MQILFQNDAAGNANPGFLADEQTAANIYDKTFTDNITVTIQAGFGEYQGIPLSDQYVSEAEINDDNVAYLAYSTLQSDLKTHGTPGFFNSTNLPANPGQTNFFVSAAQAEALGTSETGVVGYIGIGTTFAPGAERVSAMLHEIGHALGRVDDTLTPVKTDYYSEMDLWRFNAYNARNYQEFVSQDAVVNFSLNDGTTTIAQWGQREDQSDFLSYYPYDNDPYNEEVGNLGMLTNADIKLMEALGFSTVPNVINQDVTGNGTSDLILVNGGGAVIDWELLNDGYSSYNSIGSASGYTVVGTGDFMGDGVSDILLQSSSGNIIDWTIENGVYTGYTSIGNANSSGYGLVGTGDFDGNGTSDLLLENGSGALIDWMINQGIYASYNSIGNTSGYGVIGAGDFSGNGTSDVLLQNSGGSIIDWMLQNGKYASYNPIGNANTAGYGVVGTGDFNGDATTDLLLENGSGNLIDWIIQNGKYASWNEIGNASGYAVVGTGDYAGTPTAGILLESASGNIIEWTLNNGQFAGWFGIGNVSSYAVVNK